MIENVVFSSGSVMGPAFVGAYKYLLENNLHNTIKNYIGCSVGSLMCLAITLGYSYKEMEGISIGMNVNKLVNEENNILDIIDNYGFDDGSYLIKIIKILIKKKTGNPDLTFKEHYELFKKKLIVVSCNINTNQDEFFNYKTSPDMKVWEALRMSCSIPLVFTPYKYKDDYYVDGGLNNPCPCYYFKNQDKTLIFILETNVKERIEFNDFKSYLSNLIFYRIRNQKSKKSRRENCITIVLDNYNVNDGFNITPETRKIFIEKGYNTTKELLPKILENLEKKNVEK